MVSPESLPGKVAADDSVTILLNGVKKATIPSPAYGALIPFTISGDFMPGMNKLDFVVENGGGGPTGLHEQLSGTAAAKPAGTWEPAPNSQPNRGPSKRRGPTVSGVGQERSRNPVTYGVPGIPQTSEEVDGGSATILSYGVPDHDHRGCRTAVPGTGIRPCWVWLHSRG